MKKSLSLKKLSSSSGRSSFLESLESRTMFAVAADASQLVFGDVVDGVASSPRAVTFSNTGTTPLTIPAGGFSIGGAAASQFQISSAPSTDTTLAPGGSLQVGIRFNAGALGPQGATLDVVAGDNSSTAVALRGLGTKGEQGDLEPSLQWILDAYQIQSRTGDSDPAESTLDTPATLPNDEIVAPLFTKAGPGSVSIVPIAVYSNAASPALTLGYYTGYSGSTSITKKTLYTVPSADVQTLNPRVGTGTSSFDAGSAPFGLFSTWAAQNNRTVYSEDFRNTFITSTSLRRMFKVFPLTSADGSVVPNAYVIGNEEAFNHDYQDGVYIIRNVTSVQSFPPAPVAAPVQVTQLVLINADTGKDISPLVDGQTIDYAQLGTSHISIRAVVSSAPGSVKFAAGTFAHIENSAPYSINGDSGTTYTAWPAPLGASTLSVTPFSGSNATGSAGGAYVVNFTVRTGTTSSPSSSTTSSPTDPSTSLTPAVSSPSQVIYQAERATLSGALVGSANAGYTDVGYADFQNNSGDSIRWDIEQSLAGTSTLSFRYANGGATNRPLALLVNGVSVTPNLAFNPTGSWATWKTVTLSVPLAAGTNSITLSTTGSNGANFDSLTVG